MSTAIASTRTMALIVMIASLFGVRVARGTITVSVQPSSHPTRTASRALPARTHARRMIASAAASLLIRYPMAARGCSSAKTRHQVFQAADAHVADPDDLALQ